MTYAQATAAVRELLAIIRRHKIALTPEERRIVDAASSSVPVRRPGRPRTITDDEILAAIEAHGGERRAAARSLGISETTIRTRLGPAPK